VNPTAEPRDSPEPRADGTRRLATLGVSRSATPATITEYASRGSLLAILLITSLQSKNASDLRTVPCFARPVPHRRTRARDRTAVLVLVLVNARAGAPIAGYGSGGIGDVACE